MKEAKMTNAALGHLGDNVELVRHALRYMEGFLTAQDGG